VDAVPALIQALKDQDPWIRGRLFHYNAVSALGPIGSVDAVPALIQALQDQNWFVHDGATKALKKIRYTRSTESSLGISIPSIIIRRRYIQSVGYCMGISNYPIDILFYSVFDSLNIVAWTLESVETIYGTE